MKNYLSLLMLGASFAVLANAAQAADIIEEPIVIDTPAPMIESVSTGGWYIRGDIDYHRAKLDGIDYAVTGGTSAFTTTDLDDSWSLGGGIGYNVSKHFRVDLTADYWLKSAFRGSTTGTCGAPPAPCVSSDSSSMRAIVVMANAYADLGTYHGITPYVGAGVGVAHIKWDDLINTDPTGTTRHGGASSMRGAYALMAGASYCVTNNLELDAGYRYTQIGGGDMFGYANFGGPGVDKGMKVHEARAGLRYSFGGSNNRCAKDVVAYEPVNPPVYK